MTTRQGGWLTFRLDAAAMVLKAQQVIAMHLLRLPRGGFAAAEKFDRMVFKKALAIAEIDQAAATAALCSDSSSLAVDALRAVQAPVGANRKRLAAGG